MPAGRPSDYRDEYCEIVRKLTEKGWTLDDVADLLGKHRDTLIEWEKVHPEFGEAIRAGREISDNAVVAALYKKATGFDQATEKVFQYQGTPVVVPTVEHIPPDTQAITWWLKNRRPDEWHDKVDVDLTAKREEPIDIEELRSNLRSMLMEMSDDQRHMLLGE